MKAVRSFTQLFSLFSHAPCRVKVLAAVPIFIMMVSALALGSIVIIAWILTWSFLWHWQVTEFPIGLAAPVVALIIFLIAGYYSKNTGAAARLLDHAWRSEWAYQSAETCAQQRTCRLCGYRDRRDYHVWGEWEYRRENECTQERRCTRCHEEAEIRLRHDWSSWYTTPDKQNYRWLECVRCKAIAEDWTDWSLLVP